MAVLTKGTLFPAEVVADMFNTVKGKSTLAKLAQNMPVSFNGNEIFTFSMEGDINIVAEGGAKPSNSLLVAPVKVQPIKVVYQARVTDEYLYGSEKVKLNILKEFSQGAAKKLAVGLDKMGMHGVNPATGVLSPHITSYIDQVTNVVICPEGKGDEAVGDAIQLLGDYDANGVAISKAFAGMLSQETNGQGIKKFPELEWGGQPNTLKGLAASVNSTVSSTLSKDLGIVGDFSVFRWGYAKDMYIEVIEYGDPDQSGVDLKANNQVMLRTEAYIGFAVLDKAAFARVVSSK